MNSELSDCCGVEVTSVFDGVSDISFCTQCKRNPCEISKPTHLLINKWSCQSCGRLINHDTRGTPAICVICGGTSLLEENRMTEPTKEEKQVVANLERLAKVWPKDKLWLFAAAGSLHIMRYRPDGDRYITLDGGMSQEGILATIDIPCDGGDW